MLNVLLFLYSQMFHREIVTKLNNMITFLFLCFSLQTSMHSEEVLMCVKFQLSSKLKFFPNSSGIWTMKKEMVLIFFIFSAHNTPVWSELHAWESLLKIVSCVDPIMNKGPDEEFAFLCYTGFPQVSKGVRIKKNRPITIACVDGRF